MIISGCKQIDYAADLAESQGSKDSDRILGVPAASRTAAVIPSCCHSDKS